jgi:hypothetical protein
MNATLCAGTLCEFLSDERTLSRPEDIVFRFTQQSQNGCLQKENIQPRVMEDDSSSPIRVNAKV